MEAQPVEIVNIISMRAVCVMAPAPCRQSESVGNVLMFCLSRETVRLWLPPLRYCNNNNCHLTWSCDVLTLLSSPLLSSRLLTHNKLLYHWWVEREESKTYGVCQARRCIFTGVLTAVIRYWLPSDTSAAGTQISLHSSEISVAFLVNLQTRHCLTEANINSLFPPWQTMSPTITCCKTSPTSFLCLSGLSQHCGDLTPVTRPWLLSPPVWRGESGDSDKPPNVLTAKKQNISCLNRAFCGEEAWSCF